MSGETDLATMLLQLEPVLLPDLVVFCTVENARYGDLAHTQPLASMREPEGLTLVMSKEAADRDGLSYAGTFRWIRLNIHSSLHAVGLTAAVAQRLATHEISANMVAGYYHDHVFVPSDRAEQALELLRSAPC